ncbi:unnamed protein product, partial [Oncorhynchus mykiss]
MLSTFSCSRRSPLTETHCQNLSSKENVSVICPPTPHPTNCPCVVKWKSHVTERPFEDRSDVVKELYSELNAIKPHTGHLITCGNVVYVLLFGWWVSLAYLLVSILMFITIIGVPYGKMCWKLSWYFLWPFGKSIQELGGGVERCCGRFPHCEAIPEDVEDNEDTSPILLPSPTEEPIPDLLQGPPQHKPYWVR